MTLGSPLRLLCLTSVTASDWCRWGGKGDHPGCHRRGNSPNNGLTCLLMPVTLYMSKSKNGGLDQYGPERFGRLILSQSGKCGTERVNLPGYRVSVSVSGSWSSPLVANEINRQINWGRIGRQVAAVRGETERLLLYSSMASVALSY